MESQDVVDLAREAILLALVLGAPVLLVGLVVGLLVGLLQAVTQVQEQTISFVPKLVAMVFALSMTLPWVLSRMAEYSREIISNIPGNL